MTGIEAAIAAEAVEAKARRKAERQLQNKARYEAELAALDGNLSPPQPRSPSLLFSDALLQYPALSRSEVSYFTTQTPLLILSSDSYSDLNSQISGLVGHKSKSV